MVNVLFEIEDRLNSEGVDIHEKSGGYLYCENDIKITVNDPEKYDNPYQLVQNDDLERYSDFEQFIEEILNRLSSTQG